MTTKAWRRWRTVGALGLLAGALLLVACGGRRANQSGSFEPGAPQQDAAAPGAPAGGNALPEPKVQDRKIVRNANLELRVDNVATVGPTNR